MTVKRSDAFNETRLPEDTLGEQMLYFFHVQLKNDIIYDTLSVELPIIESAWTIA